MKRFVIDNSGTSVQPSPTRVRLEVDEDGDLVLRNLNTGRYVLLTLSSRVNANVRDDLADVLGLES